MLIRSRPLWLLLVGAVACLGCESARPGGFGGVDIWMASRTSTSEPYGIPENVEALNTGSGEDDPGLSEDGSVFVFSSFRAGSMDLFESRAIPCR